MLGTALVTGVVMATAGAAAVVVILEATQEQEQNRWRPSLATVLDTST